MSRSSLPPILLALLAALLPPAQAQEASALFDDSRVHDVFLNVTPNDWATLQRDYLLNTYYPAAFTWEGATLGRVGIRSRGSGSRSPEKPNLLIAFDRYDKSQRLVGLTAVVLKANNQDPSMLREILAMKMLRAMGIPAPREAPARLFINGEYFGAYTLVERIDANLLADRFGESSGYLYEWEARRTEEGYRFEYLGPDPALYSPAMWSPSNHESDPDPAPIVEMVDLVNNATDGEFIARIPEYLDVDEFLRFLAVENFSGEADGFLGTVFGMNNFYVYRLQGTKRSVLIPWDRDASFDWEYKPIFEGAAENVLARRVLSVPEWRNQYLAYLSGIAMYAGGRNGWLASELERLYELIRESAYADTHKQCGFGGVIMACGAAEFEAAVENMRRFTSSRADFVAVEAQNHIQ